MTDPKTSPYRPAPLYKPANIVALLSTIAVSEGTFGDGDDGYNVLVGNTLFDSYADHPRVLVQLKDKQGNPTYRSTAAGRYQEMEHIYDSYKGPLGLTDFGHDAQDAIAIQLLKECGAYKLIMAGQVQAAIQAASSRWASFPNLQGASAYGQPVQKMQLLVQAYRHFGGTVAA